MRKNIEKLFFQFIIGFLENSSLGVHFLRNSTIYIHPIIFMVAGFAVVALSAAQAVMIVFAWFGIGYIIKRYLLLKYNDKNFAEQVSQLIISLTGPFLSYYLINGISLRRGGGSYFQGQEINILAYFGIGAAAIIIFLMSILMGSESIRYLNRRKSKNSGT
jgi:hypothetical protein